MKHGLPRSPLSLITNFLSNIDFFERYGSNIVGVSGTLGDDQEKQFMRDTFPVEFATIPTSKRRKLFELDGLILGDDVKDWNVGVCERVEWAVARQRAVLVICDDIATADKIRWMISGGYMPMGFTWRASKPTIFTRTNSTEDGVNKALMPGDVVITTNLGARGTDYETDDVVNQNGGLFVLVTFIPLNDRVEKQAFGRTGRRGATGSCQIIVNRWAMPEWLRSCETINEAKRFRNSITKHHLNSTTEVDTLREKQTLFREYCELKQKFITSSDSYSNDLNIQTEILDETWAKWIQQYEGLNHKSNHADMSQELCQIMNDCSKRANELKSDNIYHILKFGAVRLMKGDFKEASEFYDRVISMDPAWSAFAHYNRAYCTLQIKGDGYIRRAIDDLNAAIRTLEKYNTNCLFSEIFGGTNISDYTDSIIWGAGSNRRFTKYYSMTKCQILHNIDTQIIETINKMRKIETMNGEVTTVRRDILDLIPGVDYRTENILHEYHQMGLLFTYNIDVEPQVCRMNQIVSSLVMLESVADAIFMAIFEGVLVNVRSMELKNTIDTACSMKLTGDESLGWMSRCVARAIITGIHSINFIRDVSSLVTIKQTELESSYKLTKETSQFAQFANSQASYISVLLDSPKHEKWTNLMSFQEDKLIIAHDQCYDGCFEREKIEHKICEKISTRRKTSSTVVFCIQLCDIIIPV